MAIEFPQVPAYRLDRAIYRRGDLDNPLIYRGLWGTGGLGPGQLVQPNRRAITLRFYNRDGLLTRVLSSNAQHGYLVSLSWDVSAAGCGQCDVHTTEELDLEFDYRCDVHLWNQLDPVFSGFLLENPRPGTTERIAQYTFYGGYYLLDQVYITATYAPQSVYGIVVDILRQATARLPIALNLLKIQTTTYNTSGELKFLRSKLTSVLKQLADLAGGYSWGVDADSEFFFQAPSDDIDMHTWVGKHLDTYVPREDTRELCNKLYIKAGKVRSDLPSDDPFYKTNWLPEPLEDEESQGLYRVREGEFSAPSVLNLVDAARAGQVELDRRKVPRRYATVTGLTFDGTVPAATGKARIVGRNGVEFIYPKKRLRWTVDSARIRIDLELGDYDPTPGDLFGRLAATQAAEELARQQSQQQS